MTRLTTCALALALALLGGSAAAQTLTTNAQGQRVIVYPDGRTQLFNEAAPEEGPSREPTSGRTSPVPQGVPPRQPAPSITLQPGTTLSAQTTPEQEADAKLEVRRRVARLTEEYAALTRIAKKARSREAKLANRVRKLRNSRKVTDRAEVEIVNQQLLDARETTQTAEDGRASVETRANALRETLTMTIAGRDSYLNGLGLGYLLAEADAPASPPPGSDRRRVAEPARPPAPEVLATDADPAPATEFAAYDRRRDTRFTPPTPACTREFDGLDEFTSKRRVVLAEETFFTYTSPDLKPFLKDASLITCRARLMRTGKVIALETTFVIRSQFASKEFGVLPKGSQMTFRAVNGEQLSLKNQVQSQAEYDPVAKVSIYKGRYLLGRGAQKFLEDALLDEVRVMWGTGFDDYAVYDLTFLQRQLDCI